MERLTVQQPATASIRSGYFSDGVPETAIRKAYLRPEMEIADVATERSFPSSLRANPEQWSGCVFGALPEQVYLDLVSQAGFRELKTQPSQNYGEDQGVKIYSLAIFARK